MAELLRDAASPYLRAHADNPVDWWPWGPEPFAEAARRGVPVLVSVGYATCHWCHVMARESFSAPEIAAIMNEHFVNIKVDREEHAEVDAAMMASAAAFTQHLGWPLNVFVTPAGHAFFAGTYWPPQPAGGSPSFEQVLEAVTDAWTERREQVERIGGALAEALAQPRTRGAGTLPGDLTPAVAALAGQEDQQFGGFGGAPKFPVATVLGLLLERGLGGDADAQGLAERTLAAIASGLQDRDGGVFRYATGRDWTEPHYERMLYDNAQLLECFALAGLTEAAEGVARFLLGTLRLPSGAFASAQDSESVIEGQRNEGGYFKRDEAGRAQLQPPAIDEKVLTGWNGLAIRGLTVAGRLLGKPEWIDAARAAADMLLQRHLLPGRLVRASIGDTVSGATATLEDYGLLADGLLHLATATGEVEYMVAARNLVNATLAEPVDDAEPARRAHSVSSGGDVGSGVPVGPAFAVPGDPVLAGQGLTIEADPSDGALPSGPSAIASAALHLHALTGDRRYRDAAVATMERVADVAVAQPIAMGAALTVMSRLAEPARQLLVVDEPGSELAQLALRESRGVVAVATPAQAEAFSAAGFELYEGRAAGAPAAYLCEDFTCRLPARTAEELAAQLAPTAAPSSS